ncbi:MAG: glycoside hydrolase family 88 protein [Bacilli bacterium]
MVEHYIDRILSSISVEKIKSWSYEDGLLRKAIFDLYRATNKDKYYEFVLQYYQDMITEDGQIRFFKDVENPFVAGLPLFDVYEYTEQEKYRLAIEQLAATIRSMPRNEEGFFLELSGETLSLDKSFKILLFYAKYAYLIQDESMLSDMKKQFLGFLKTNYLPEKKLYSDRSLKVGNTIRWVGGMGFLAVALVDVLSFYFDPELASMFQQLIEGLDDYKHNYMWFQIVDQPTLKDNFVEVSGTFMLCYAYLKGAKYNLLSPKYYINGIDIYQQTRSRYFEEDKEEWHLKEIHPLKDKSNVKEVDYLALPCVLDDVDGVAPFILIYAQLKKGSK